MKTFQQYISMDEAWTADSVVKNATIGSKKGYGINIKKGGGITKAPYKHMLLTTRKHGNVRVTFDHGKEEFEGTPQSVALHINQILGIKESVEHLDEKPIQFVKDLLKGPKKVDVRGWKAKVHHGRHPDVPDINSNGNILFAINPKTGEEEHIASGKLSSADIKKFIKMYKLKEENSNEIRLE